MVDREARNKLAEQIRYFLSCLTDNFQFDDEIFKIETDDVAVTEIRNQMWHTYDDVLSHKLEGRKALNEKDIEIVKRFILFLKTDIELEKVKDPSKYELWPFLNISLYKKALQDPWYMTNTTNTT